MLSHFFEAPTRIREIRSGPSGSLIEGFADYLFQNGYAEISARRHIRSAEHIVQWTGRTGLSVSEMDDPALKGFWDHLNRCRCGRYSRSDRVNILTGARLFLRHSQGVDTGGIRIPACADSTPMLLESFYQWMHEHRGTSDGTLHNYGVPIRELIRRFGENPEKWDAQCLRTFVLSQSRSVGWAAVKHCTTALRMLLRFLTAEGRCRAGLIGAIPKIAHWRLSSLPAYLSPEEVERVIDSCDVSSPVGKRNRAILLLLARLGLRAGDIVKMSLQDIDWKGAWVHVSGKGRRQTRLPLTQEVGDAIVSYVQEGRPRSHTDALFLRSHAPFRAFRSHCAVSEIVSSTMRRAGIKRPGRGAAHLLRHSVASSMLRRGASLQEISALLRHRSIETTQIYAKIDVTALQQIAQPWPEVWSC
jgi:site-specific recombinase XerD